MHRRKFFTTALLGAALLVPALTRAADEKAAKDDKPAIMLRFASLDHLRGDFRYLAEVVGEGEKAKQLDGIIKSKLGDKGLGGIDNKKPIGAYGWVGSFGIDSKAVLLVPIADKKAFIDFVSDTLDVKPEKGDDDVYTLNVERVPAPIYFRFANDYAYITVRDKDVIDKNKLLAPSVVLPAGQIGTFSVLINIDQIPDDLKEKGLGVIENQLAAAKEKDMPDETEAQKKFRQASVDEIAGGIKSLLNNGGETTLRLDLDRKAGDLTLTASVAGKPGSSLASTIREWGQVKSLTASLLRSNAALKGELNVTLTEKLRGLLGPALKDMQTQALAKARDDKERQLRASLAEALMPTLRAAELDTAFDLQGPNADGLYTLVGGLKVKNGEDLDKTFRKTVGKDATLVKLDADKVDQVAIHRVTPKKVDPGAQRTFGKNPMYIAFRDDVMLVAVGAKGLETLKEALAIAPTTGKLVDLQVAVARLAPLAEDRSARDIARKVFGDDRDGDRLRLTLEGGKALTLRLSLKAKLIDYVNQVEKAKKQ